MRHSLLILSLLAILLSLTSCKTTGSAVSFGQDLVVATSIVSYEGNTAEIMIEIASNRHTLGITEIFPGGTILDYSLNPRPEVTVFNPDESSWVLIDKDSTISTELRYTAHIPSPCIISRTVYYFEGDFLRKNSYNIDLLTCEECSDRYCHDFDNNGRPCNAPPASSSMIEITQPEDEQYLDDDEIYMEVESICDDRVGYCTICYDVTDEDGNMVENSEEYSAYCDYSDYMDSYSVYGLDDGTYQFSATIMNYCADGPGYDHDLCEFQASTEQRTVHIDTQEPEYLEFVYPEDGGLVEDDIEIVVSFEEQDFDGELVLHVENSNSGWSEEYYDYEPDQDGYRFELGALDAGYYDAYFRVYDTAGNEAWSDEIGFEVA